MGPDFNTSPQKSEIKYPDGYENWSMDDKQKFENIENASEETLSQDPDKTRFMTEEARLKDERDIKEETPAGKAFTYSGYRLARGVASFGAAGKERKKAVGKKLLTTIGTGAGAGLLSSLTEHIVIDSEASVVSAPGKIFEDSSILKHEVVAGDSTWKILKGALENSEQFKGMTEAQQTYVLSSLTNKVLQNPENYGLNKAGGLNIGDKTDFTKLFENTKEVNGVFAKAKETIMEGGPQEKSILLNNEKIAAWVEAHPSESLDEDRVTEILNSKPEIKPTPITETLIGEPAPEPEPASQIEPEPQPGANNVSESPTDVGGENNNAEILASGTVLTGAGLVAGLNGKALIEREIEEAKKRLRVLEEGKDKNKFESYARNPNLERSLANDLNSARNGSELDQAVNAAKEETVNHFFTEGFILKKEGVKSKKWKFIKNISFPRLEKYYKGDSNMSGLSLEITNELNKSSKYKDFFDHISWLKDQTDGAVILAEGEDPSIELVLQERGKYLLKNPQLAKLKKAA